MKIRAKWWIAPALAVSLAACKKQEATTADPQTGQPVISADGEPAPATKPDTPGISLDERAAKLGFAKHLPKDIEVLASFHNGSQAADKLKTLKLWKLIESEMGGGFDPDALELDIDMEQDDLAENETDEAEDEFNGEIGPKDALGSEVTIAMGKTTGEQFGNLLTLNRRLNYFRARTLAQALVETAQSGEAADFIDIMAGSFSEDLVRDLVNDPESGLNLLEKSNFPPLYVAMRVEPSKLEAATEQISGPLHMLANMGEMIAPVETERNGAKFTGYKVLGEQISGMLESNRSDMDETLGTDAVDRLIKIIADKNLVALSGNIGDYVVLFIGASEDDFQPAASTPDSYVSTDALAFADAYVGKELLAVISGDKATLSTMMDQAGGFADMAKGARDGLASGEGLGETRDLEALLELVIEREAALLKFTTVEATGTVAFLEDGVKIESYGGINSGALDLKTPAKLASLGASEDVALFINGTANAAYDEKYRAYIESILETAYAITLKVSEIPDNDGDLAQFKEMASLFDTQFRPDVVALWDALGNDLASGLGAESALVIDLKGSMPAVPGVPKAVLDNARIPRITLLSSVEDRTKIATAWEKINTSTTNLLAKVSEMIGTELPMQKPISSEKNGLTTWFFSMPFFNDDFLPSVTVGDEWFAAGTSKDRSQELLEQASAAQAGPAGLTFHVNFRSLQAYASETFKMVEENASEIFGEDSGKLEDFNENKQNILKAIEALDDFDSLNVRVYVEGSTDRLSTHFKTR